MSSYRQRLLRSVPCGLLAALGQNVPAGAQPLNLYHSTSSVVVPYANGTPGQTSLIGSPSLSVGFNGGTAKGFTMDTGSVGIVVSPDVFTPSANAISKGPGEILYNSSGIKSTGTLWMTDVQIYNKTSGEVMATAGVPVLVVTGQSCIPNARACTISPGTTIVPQGVSMFGIGFGQEAEGMPNGVPANNPLLNITSIATGGTPSHGYVLTTSGVEIGLTPANTAGFALVKLAPYAQYPGDWMRAPASVKVNGAVGSGTILMDTGVPGMFLTAPTNAKVKVFSSDSLECASNCAVGGTSIAVYLPGQTGPIASYNFTLNPDGQHQRGNPLAPQYVSVDKPNDTTFINTTFHFLNGFTYYYDNDNGFVGFKWNGNVSDNYGGATPSFALQGTFAIAAGFATDLPFILSSNSQAGTPTTVALAGSASLSGSISGSGGLTYSGGIATVTGVNTYTGSTTINDGTVLVKADSAFGDASGGLALNSGTIGALAPLNSARSLTLTGSNGLAGWGNPIALSGPISGTGSLTISGGGTVTLTGANSYTGPTTVNGSTLAVGSASLAGSSLTLNNAALVALGNIAYAGPLTLGGTADVINAGANQVVFSGSLSGSAALTTIGNVAVLGDVAIGGGHVVQQGTFSVAGTVTATSLTIGSGGTLGGVGTIAAPTTVAGTLAPGSSPGTLTFVAPVTQLPGSTLRIDIDGVGIGNGAGNHDRVVVQGSGNSFTAGGTLVPILRGITGDATNSYTPPIGQSFTIVQAQGGVVGSFAGLTQPADGLPAGSRFDVLYGTTAIALVLTPASYGNLGAAGLAETSGQAAVGSAIDAVRPAPGAPLTPNQAAFYAPLYGLPAAIIPAALDQLGPSIYGSALMTARDGWYSVTDTIGRHMDASRSNLPVGGHQVWVTSLGDFSHIGPSGGLGYSGTTAGAVAGIDMRPHENWSGGLALGYLNLQTSNTASAQMSGDSLHALLYGGWQQGILFVDGQTGGFALEGNSQRALDAWGLQARGNTNGHGVGGNVRVGMQLPYASWQIEPSVQLGGVSLSQGALTESQGGVLALSVGHVGLASVQSLAGVSASRQYILSNDAVLVPSARVGWAHEYVDQNASVTAALAAVQTTGFTVSTPGTGRDAAIVGLGAELRFASQLSLHIDYRGAFRSNSNAQQLTGGMRYVW